MERVAFARARRYLSYAPAAVWNAALAAVAAGGLHVGLLVALGLFADLIVHRGHIPAYQDLLPAERNAFAAQWLAEDREALLTGLKIPDTTAQNWSTADPRWLTPRDREMVWRAYVYDVLTKRVSAEAGAAYLDHLLAGDDPVGVGEPAADPLAGDPLAGDPLADRDETRGGRLPLNLGVLSLIVRGREWVCGPGLGAVARWNPWMWRYARPGTANYVYLAGLLALALVLTVLMTLADFALHVGAAGATTEAVRRLRRALYHHAYRQGALAVRSTGPSETTGVFTRHVEAVHDGLYTWLTVDLAEPIKFCLLLGFAVLTSVWLAVTFASAVLLLWGAGGQFAAYFRRRSRTAVGRAAAALGLLQESLAMIRLVTCFRMERFNQARVERQLAEFRRGRLGRARDEARYRAVLVFLCTTAALILLAVCGLVVLTGGLGVVSLITLVAALVSLYRPLVAWVPARAVLRRAGESARVVFRFLDRPEDPGQFAGAEPLPRLARGLEYRGVSLSEPGTGRLLLCHVSLTVPVGTRVGVVGPDDPEKQALLYLLPRLLDPTAGAVLYDDLDARGATLDSLRRQVVLVMRQNLVFTDTVANNISCGDPDWTLPQLIEAAKVAHAHQFIIKLPQGYQTRVGEMGHPLSVGEQFRIGLARAVLRDPAVLVIEEPAGPLDDDTTEAVEDTYARILPGRTAVFLAHRAETLRSCDRVVLLHKGQVEATGTHAELLAANELYRHLQYLEFNERG